MRVIVQRKSYDFIARGKRYALDTSKPEVFEDFDEKWYVYLSRLNNTSHEASRCNFTMGEIKRTLGNGQVETVVRNAGQYTVQEQGRAAEARDLIRKMGFNLPALVHQMLVYSKLTDAVKVYNPRVRKNTMQRLTTDVIALGQSEAWVFWHITMQRPIVRGRAIAQPMSDARTVK